MQWDSDYIKVWHFARGEIPSDIGEKAPNPETWGMPQAIFGSSRCDVDDYFKDMSLVINIVSYLHPLFFPTKILTPVELLRRLRKRPLGNR